MEIKIRLWLLTAVALLSMISLVPMPSSAQTSNASIMANDVHSYFTILVSRSGFNGTEGPFTLDLVQGSSVHLTFLYDDNDLPYDNPHVVFLQGYDLKTSVISRSHPYAGLDFVADRTGTFSFYCILPCEGMENLELGEVVVEPHPAGRLSTSIDVKLEGTAVQGQAVSIIATLKEGSQPISNARLSFYLNTTFGLVRLGTAVTDDQGTAIIGHSFARSGEFTVIVRFDGMEDYAPSSKLVDIHVEPDLSKGEILVSIVEGPTGGSLSRFPYVRGQNQMPDVRLVGVPFSQGLPIVTLILLIVGSVWVAYGYVFAQIRAIKRGSPIGRDRDEGGVGRMENATSKKGLDKRMLVGAILVAVVVVGFFAYYQFGAAPQSRTETIKIDIRMQMLNGEERHVFDPTTVTVRKGDHVVLIVTNSDDDAIHGVIIPELNLNTGPLSSGQSATLEFDATTTGAFTILCPVPGCAPDHSLMIAQLIVT